MTYPIGLITADEVVYAGGVLGRGNDYYIYTGQDYWGFTPSIFNTNGFAGVFRVGLYGNLYNNYVYFTAGVRPVINLKADVTISSGNGTSTNPYIIN